MLCLHLIALEDSWQLVRPGMPDTQTWDKGCSIHWEVSFWFSVMCGYKNEMCVGFVFVCMCFNKEWYIHLKPWDYAHENIL